MTTTHTTISAMIGAHLYVEAMPRVVAAARRRGGDGDHVRVVLIGGRAVATRVSGPGHDAGVFYVPVAHARSETDALNALDRWLTAMERAGGDRPIPVTVNHPVTPRVGSPVVARGADVSETFDGTGAGHKPKRGRRGGRNRRRPEREIAASSTGQTAGDDDHRAGADAHQPATNARVVAATSTAPVTPMDDRGEAAAVARALAILRERGILRDTGDSVASPARTAGPPVPAAATPRPAPSFRRRVVDGRVVYASGV